MKESPFSAKPIQVIQVRGDDYEIGRQHAEQVKADIPEGMLKFYDSLWSNFTKTKAGKPVQNISKKAALKMIQSLLINNLHGQVPDWMSARIRAMADVTSLPSSQLFLSLVLPDLFPILQALFMRAFPHRGMQFRVPAFGCSSFIKEGTHFLHGRNLDFPGVGYWDKFPVIQVTHRTNSLKYIGFTSSGVPLCGITGVNEAQISVSLHQHYSLEFSVKGQLPYVTAEKILAKAKTLSEALTILESSKIASAWAFIVTDGKTRNGFIYETHSKDRGVRYLKGSPNPLTHSNYFQCQECKPGEYSTTAKMNWDNYWRNSRLNHLVKTDPDLTPEKATQYISDHVDGYWKEEKIANRIVSQAFNIQSLVLDTSAMKVWMAEGNSPVQLGKYREFDLGKLFAGKTESEETSFSGYRFEKEAVKKSKEKYIASVYHTFAERYDEAFQQIMASVEASPFPENYHVAGMLALKMGRFEAGEQLLERGRMLVESKMKERDISQPPPEYFEICLFLARAKDLSGRRDEALAMYRNLAADPRLEDKSVRYLAVQARPYKPKDVAKIIAPFSGYIPFL